MLFSPPTSLSGLPSLSFPHPPCPPACCSPPAACCAGVGKTCLLLRYANDSFSPTFITTIGIDFKIKTIEVEGKRIKLQVRAGQQSLLLALFSCLSLAHSGSCCGHTLHSPIQPLSPPLFLPPLLSISPPCLLWPPSLRLSLSPPLSLSLCQIWDTAGQERFRTITTSYFRGAQGILLVYDVTDRGSFQAIKTWVEEIERNADKHVNKILIGNKCDVEDSARAVTRAEGEALARDFSMKFFETSAKKNIQVGEAFESIAVAVVDRMGKEGARPIAGGAGAGVKLETKEASGKKGCC